MNTPAHESILRSALGDGCLNAQALDRVVRSNLESDSDFHQLDAKRHFDNAADVPMLAHRWEKGLHAWFLQALSLAAPGRFNGKRSLSAFGMASHALADFYAHTDWIEIHAALGDPDKLAPFTGSAFPVELFPAQLSSGYFSLRYGLDGCPGRHGSFQPPRPFRHCHATISKDYPDRDHGAELSPDGRNYFEIAISSSVRATRALWEEYKTLLTRAYGPDHFQRIALGR
jgi:hypothetical protein